MRIRLKIVVNVSTSIFSKKNKVPAKQPTKGGINTRKTIFRWHHLRTFKKTVENLNFLISAVYYDDKCSPLSLYPISNIKYHQKKVFTLLLQKHNPLAIKFRLTLLSASPHSSDIYILNKANH